MPMFFLSNALFPTEGLPRMFRALIRLNPLSYGMDGIRGAMGGTYQFSFTTDFAVLATLTAAVLVLASYLFSRIQV